MLIFLLLLFGVIVALKQNANQKVKRDVFDIVSYGMVVLSILFYSSVVISMLYNYAQTNMLGSILIAITFIGALLLLIKLSTKYPIILQILITPMILLLLVPIFLINFMINIAFGFAGLYSLSYDIIVHSAPFVVASIFALLAYQGFFAPNPRCHVPYAAGSARSG